MPGPVPKRSEVRRRRNKPEGGEITRAKASSGVSAPDADPDWHPIAIQWYESLSASGQSYWYEPSDWATAYFIAEAMTKNLNAGRFSGQLFAAIMSAMTELLTTEGARRRARAELEKEAIQDDASVTAIADYKRELGIV